MLLQDADLVKVMQVPHTTSSWKMTGYLHDFSGDFLFAEPIDDDMGGDSGHTEHPALRAPGQSLDGKRILIYYVCARLLLLTTRFLKHLGSLQLVQYLKHYFETSKESRERGDYHKNAGHGGVIYNCVPPTVLMVSDRSIRILTCRSIPKFD